MRKQSYKLDELAEAAGTSPRTVRYYVQRGLLRAPQFRGKDTAYDHEHLVRLRAIRVLQDRFFPLDAIEVELERRTLSELERLVDGQDVVGSPPAPPAEPARTAPLAHAAQGWKRITIAEGVEISIADDAPVASREWVERILSNVEKGGAR